MMPNLKVVFLSILLLFLACSVLRAGDPPVACNCTITQSGNTYGINALAGNESAVDFYSYGDPNGSSANTGLEMSNALTIFLYEDVNTGTISLFLIADIANSGSGGSLNFEANCLPLGAFVSVQDDGGEFNGTPPLIVGDWGWGPCCTDGGVIENIGCNNTINLDLLVSSGIDSIVWLTGDIANPTHILLDMSGNDIMIDCGGGGICCPVGLDTEIALNDATCNDTPNGSASLTPQDGTAPYSYLWSNGASTSFVDDLLPGSYTITVTDAQGCSETVFLTIGTSPGDPVALPASIELCSLSPEEIFDLTTTEHIINNNTSYNVLWFEDAAMAIPIADPVHFLSGSTNVYAVVDNGSCLSDPVSVTLVLHPTPVGMAASLNACEETNAQATFDLTTIEDLISGGTGTVDWYEDVLLTDVIDEADAFFTNSTTVYATVMAGPCTSDPIPVTLVVDLQPEANAQTMELCADENDEATFDLTSVESTVGGVNMVTWYLDMELLDLIIAPHTFITTSTVVYATVFDGTCYADPVPVTLDVLVTPIGTPLTITMCDDGDGDATFDLTQYDQQIAVNQGGVDWYFDAFGEDPIPNPQSFSTESTIVFAVIDNGFCLSDPVPVELIVTESIPGNSTSLETCADSSGVGVFNLLTADTLVSGGNGIVFWYEDPQAVIPIVTPESYESSGSVVYAQIADGNCLSVPFPVDLIIVNTLTANPAQYALCDEGDNTMFFNLHNIEIAVSGGSGMVSWFADAAGSIPVSAPEMFEASTNTTVFALVTAGSCISEIVPVELVILPAPLAGDAVTDLCGDMNGSIIYDLTTLNDQISLGTGTVHWFADSALTISILNPSFFATGDTVLHAFVSNGVCSSLPVTIDIHVVPMPVAQSVNIDLCKAPGDTLQIDLLEYNNVIGAMHQVNWYEDTSGLIEISSPSDFESSASQVLYAGVSDGVCVSALAPVVLTILDYPEANTITVRRCGDLNGQALFDLVSVENLISENTGIVSWYADTSLSTPLSNPSSFTTGDTIIYAIVANGFCVSTHVPVTLEIVDSLTVNAISIEACVAEGGPAELDLTMTDLLLSGGSGMVQWYHDEQGLLPLADPSLFITSGDTLYVKLEADGCESEIVAIPIVVAEAFFPEPVCAFTSIDSIAISWNLVTHDYGLQFSVNGQSAGNTFLEDVNLFSIGGLGEGDTVLLILTALYDSICTMPLTDTLVCITDVCPQQHFQFPGLLSEYCEEESFVALNAEPPGGQFSGNAILLDTLYPSLVLGNSADIHYAWSDSQTGCMYDTSWQIQIASEEPSPSIACIPGSLSAVSFEWTAVADEYAYQYAVNQNSVSSVMYSSSTNLIIDQLTEGDDVTLWLWSVGNGPCGNSDTISITCQTRICPPVVVDIPNPGILCEDGDPVQLQVDITGPVTDPEITWSGFSLIDPAGIILPALAFENDKIYVEVEENGCRYSDSVSLAVLMENTASFDIIGTPCVDSIMQLEFSGVGYGSATWHWDYGGAQVTEVEWPVKYDLRWDEPGEYELSLWIDYHGCYSDTFVYPVTIDAPLGIPEIKCVEEDYYSIAIEWEPVQGATEYIVTASAGNGTLSGLTYRITGLPDDTPVLIEVVATGSACGNTSSTIECTTLDYVEPAIYFSNVFTPDHDGINDVFFIQANDRIAEIHLFRIFDRWGNLVFEDTDFLPNDASHGWDGSYNDKDVNPGVYVYVVEWETVYGVRENLTGDVTVVR